MGVTVAIDDLMRLPGVPTTPRGMRKLLKRVGVRRRRRAHDGLYEMNPSSIPGFPIAAQPELLKLFPSGLSESAESLMRAESGRLASADSIPVIRTGGAPRTLERGDFKSEIVLAFRTFRDSAGGTLRAALRSFVALYNDGRIEVSAETRAAHPRLAVPTLERDWRKFARGGPSALARKDSNRNRDSIIARTPKMREFILSMIAHQPHVRVARIFEAMKARFPNEKRPVRSTLQNFVAQWKQQNPALMMRLRDPDNWKRRYLLALGDAAADITRVNQLWEIDGTPADVMCLDGRWHLNCVIDVRSRKMCVLLTPTASADGTARLLVKAIGLMGVPETVKSDWGKEYQNKRIERSSRRLGFFIVEPVARKYAGELKPFAERGQGTILHNCLEQVDGYLGHSVAEAAEIRARNSFQERRGERRNLVKLYNVRLTASELQDVIDRWLNAVYGNNKHAGLHGSSPNAEFAAGEARGEVRRIADERLLDVLFGEDGVSTVSSKGLRIKGAQFWADDLIPWLGRRIEWIRTRDAGKLIIYSHEEHSQFITIAQDITASGIDRAVVAIAAKQRQKKLMNEQLAELRRLRNQHHPERLLEEIISHAEASEAAKLAPQTSITAMPAQGAGLREAASALAALESKSAPLEHADRAEVDAQYEEIANEENGGGYDEDREAAEAVERYQRLLAMPRAKWTADDLEFVQLARELPEIRALTRRSA
jgi:hypothetical protein